jgi:hypothetical protein
MKIEQLEKGIKIADDIAKCNENIEKAKYMQCEQVVIRDSYLECNGVDGNIVIPKSLFRFIGELIVNEYQQELNRLQNEFESL